MLAEREHGGTGVLESTSSRLDTEQIALVGPGVAEPGEGPIVLGNRGEHRVVEVRRERLYEVDVVTELCVADLVLGERPTEPAFLLVPRTA